MVYVVCHPTKKFQTLGRFKLGVPISLDHPVYWNLFEVSPGISWNQLWNLAWNLYIHLQEPKSCNVRLLRCLQIENGNLCNCENRFVKLTFV